jgi:DNA-binding IclR family transcriptional regulator
VSVVELRAVEEEPADRPSDGGAGSSVSKALALLRVVVETSTASRLSDLADAVDLPKSTTHRLLKALEEAGFVGRAGPRYQIGDRAFELAQAAHRSRYGSLRDAAQAPLGQVFVHGSAAVHLAVLEGREVLYLEKLTGRDGCTLPTRVGARMPATCTALGKAILAHSPLAVVRDALAPPLPRTTAYSIADPRRLVEELGVVRRDGVAWEREEARLGVSCVAAPVLAGGIAVAAVSVSMIGRDSPSVQHGALVRTAASQIAARLSFLPTDLPGVGRRPAGRAAGHHAS